MRVISRAPAKVILFGEHYVVYGAPGIVAAVEPYNEIELDSQESGRPGFDYRSTVKENDVSVDLADFANAAPSAQNAPSTHSYAQLYKSLAGKYPGLKKMRVDAQVKHAWPLKGVGNSASLGAALGAGIRTLAGEKRISANALFDDAQTADEVAHGGGRPSGIDAAAAAYGGVMEFAKNFKNLAKPQIKQMKIAKMADVEFVLIDTFKTGEKRGSTSDLISAFAKSYSVSKRPGELSAAEREGIFDAYLPIQHHAAQALEEGEWESLGVLMDENHKLVSEHGVSSPGIERAVAIAKSFGALGAKLSGAGGAGGVVVALVNKKKSAKMRGSLAVGGFKTYPFKLAGMGAHAKEMD